MFEFIVSRIRKYYGEFFFGAFLTAAVLLMFFIVFEARAPYYFLQDDNRVIVLPSLMHCFRSLAGAGQLQQYNFHQFLGYPSFAGSAALYPFIYPAVWLSNRVAGNIFATVDILTFFHLFIGGTAFFLLMRKMKFRAAAAFFGASAWVLNPFVIFAGTSWWVVTATAAYFPLMILLSLQLKDRPSLASFMALVLSRVLLCYIGYPQYFVYSCVLEAGTIALALFINEIVRDRNLQMMYRSALDSRGGKLDSARETVVLTAKVVARICRIRRAFLITYVFSYIVVLLLCMPVIWPMYQGMLVSYDRNDVLKFGEFGYLNYNPLKWVFGLFYPWTDWESNKCMDKLAYLGYLPLALVVMLAVKLKRRENIAPHRVWVYSSALLAVFCWLWAIGALNPFEYVFPLFNRFRWHFKIMLFANFYFLILASAAAEYLLAGNLYWKPRARLTAKILVTAHLLNMLALYTLGLRVTFRDHKDLVPLKEGQVAALSTGRVFSVGYQHMESFDLDSVGFNFATLWQVFHLAGYEVLLPKRNFELGLKLNYESFYRGRINDDMLKHLRTWGVKWYSVAAKAVPLYGPFLESRGILPYAVEQRRTLYLDSAAMPLAYSSDGRSLDLKVSGNMAQVTVPPGRKQWVTLNFLYDRDFFTTFPGAELKAGPDGKIMVLSPASGGTIDVRYKNPYIKPGVVCALFGLLLAGLGWLFCAKYILAGSSGGVRARE